MDSHPYSHETSIFTLRAPHVEVQGRRTKLHPGFTMGKLVQQAFKFENWWRLKKSSPQSVEASDHSPGIIKCNG